LYRYSNDIKYLNIIGKSMESVSGLIDKSPLDLPSWFKLYYLMEEDNSEIFISGNNNERFYKESLKFLLSSYLPNTIIVSEDPYDENFYLPIMEERLNDKKSKIYICENYVCDLPIDNMKDLNEKIDNIKGAYKSK